MTSWLFHNILTLLPKFHYVSYKSVNLPAEMYLDWTWTEFSTELKKCATIPQYLELGWNIVMNGKPRWMRLGEPRRCYDVVNILEMLRRWWDWPKELTEQRRKINRLWLAWGTDVAKGGSLESSQEYAFMWECITSILCFLMAVT